MKAAKRAYPPSCNTGGTSIQPTPPLNPELAFKPLPQGGQKVICDTFAVTVCVADRDVVRQLLIEQLLPGAHMSDQGQGTKGFAHQQQIMKGNAVLGWYSYGGGPAMKGRSWIYVGGAGMRYRRSMGKTDETIPTDLEPLNPRYTRVDLALDVYSKEVYSVEQCQKEYAEQLFRCGKSATDPFSRLIQSGRPGERQARTQYIGKPSSGKQIRVYDKGMQILGNLDDDQYAEALKQDTITAPEVPEGCDLRDWVRIEIQYNRGDRELGPKEFIERDRCFAGAYPATAKLLDRADGYRPDYIPDDDEVVLAKLICAGRESYGGLIHHLKHYRKWSDQKIVDVLIGGKSSKKINAIAETSSPLDYE